MLRFLIFAMLALVLALTSQSMAVARGASAATGQMVLCTGAGPVAFYVDAQGQPTSAPHICPDAAMHVPAAMPAPLAHAPMVLLRPFTAAFKVVTAPPVVAQTSTHPRAPPMVV